MKNLFILLALLFLSLPVSTVLAQETGQATGDSSDKLISGYYKNLFFTSKSLYTKEGVTADLQRVRLEFKKETDPWQFYLSLDNDLIFDDFDNTMDFDFIRSKAQDRLSSVDADKVSVDNEHMYLKHAIYRAYIKYYKPEYQVAVGKQTVDWGKMYFYSPLDLFNPINPIDLERDQRIGIDAINFNYSPEGFSGINVVIAPGETEDESFGVRLFKTIANYDFSVIAALIREDQIAGASFDGSIKDAGFRGEISFTRTDDKREFARASIGLDYNLTKDLYVLVEQFYNGGHEDNDPVTFFSSYRFSQRVLSMEKNLSSILFKYTVTPLIELNNSLIYDWDGQSLFFNPAVNYSVTPNLDLSVGTQLYWGETNTEFGDNEHIYYAELKWFF